MMHMNHNGVAVFEKICRVELKFWNIVYQRIGLYFDYFFLDKDQQNPSVLIFLDDVDLLTCKWS